jgi:threonine dehydrogenase-like Zn-dependent dehydrogenase
VTDLGAGIAARLQSRRMVPADLDRAIELVERGTIDLSALVSDRRPLSAAPTAFAALAERRGLKVIVRPDAA